MARGLMVGGRPSGRVSATHAVDTNLREAERMTESLIRELRALCADRFTGTIVLHFEQGAVKMYETHERRRPKPDGGKVELTEARKGR